MRNVEVVQRLATAMQNLLPQPTTKQFASMPNLLVSVHLGEVCHLATPCMRKGALQGGMHS